jgi:hypothetical protein
LFQEHGGLLETAQNAAEKLLDERADLGQPLATIWVKTNSASLEAIKKRRSRTEDLGSPALATYRGNRGNVRKVSIMRGYKGFLSVLAFSAAFLFAPASKAQVSVGIGIGGPPPVCSWGYYSYPPYACAPYGFYGPGYFYNGIFLGVGPWANWGYGHGWGGHRFYGANYRGAGFGYRGGYGAGYHGGYGAGRSAAAYHGGYAAGRSAAAYHGGYAAGHSAAAYHGGGQTARGGFGGGGHAMSSHGGFGGGHAVGGGAHGGGHGGGRH